MHHRLVLPLVHCIVVGIGSASLAHARLQGTEAGALIDDRGVRAALPPPELLGLTATRPVPHAIPNARSHAGGPQANWTPIGPYGGNVADVAESPVNPNIVLAGGVGSIGGGDLYRSVDGGSTWSLEPALSGRSIFDIEFAGSGAAYLGTSDGVWKSIDGGVSWFQLDIGVGLNDTVFEIAIDSGNPLHVWAGLDDAVGNQPINVIRSSDGGASWVNATPPRPSPMACHGLSVNGSQKVYACFGGAFGGGQLWYSGNGGTTWVNRSAGLPNRPLFDVAYDGFSVFVCGGQRFGSQLVGLYVSGNDGQAWSPVSDESWPSRTINDIEFSPDNPLVMLLASDDRGVFRTTDGGATWSFGEGGTGSVSARAVRFAPGSSSRIYVGSNSTAVLKSTDSGASFHRSSEGIAALECFSVASNPLNAQELAVAFQGWNDGGIFTSPDGGQTWVLEDVPPTRYNVVRFAPTGVLHAISGGPSTIAPEGLYRRDPDGWNAIGPDQGALYESDLVCLYFDPGAPDLIITGGRDFGVVGREATIWRSENAGLGWTKAFEGVESVEYVEAIDGHDAGGGVSLLAGVVDYAQQTGGALVSVDGGASWGPSNAGLPFNVQIPGVCVRPGNPMEFFLADASPLWGGAPGGVYRSSDGGQSWAWSGYMGAARLVVPDPAFSQNLYMIEWVNATVLMSNDGGANFQPFQDGLESAIGVGALAYVMKAVPQLLAATLRGVYATQLSPVTAVFPDGAQYAAAPLGHAYPNPFAATATVSFHLREEGEIDLAVFEPGGRRVRTLVAGRVGAGSWVARWDGSDDAGSSAAPGIYLVRIREPNGQTFSRKLVRVR